MSAQAEDIVKELLEHELVPIYRDRTARLHELTRNMIIWRQDVADCFDKWLFEKTTRPEKAASWRQTSAEWGLGGLYTAMVGEQEEAVSPYVRLVVERHEGERTYASTENLKEIPEAGKVPFVVPKEFKAEYGNLYIEGLHISEGEGSDAISDVRFQITSGAAEEPLSKLADGANLERIVHSANVSKDQVDEAAAEKYKTEWMSNFPETNKFILKYVDLDNVSASGTTLPDGKVMRMNFHMPIHRDNLCGDYPALGELINIFQPLVLRFKHPVTKALLSETRLQGGIIYLINHHEDGLPVGEDGARADWEADGSYKALLEVDCTLVPLGEGLAEVPLCQMLFNFHAKNTGEITLNCVETKPSARANVSSLAFNEEKFRELMVQSFGLNFGLIPVNGGWAGRTWMRMQFPSGSVNNLLEQWFQLFINNQLKSADILKIATDFSGVLIKDLDGILKR